MQDTLINFSLAVGYNVCRSLLIPLMDLNYEEKTYKTQANRIRNAISYSAVSFSYNFNSEAIDKYPPFHRHSLPMLKSCFLFWHCL